MSTRAKTIAALSLLAIAITSTTLQQVMTAHDAAIDNGVRESQNLSRFLAQQAEDTVRASDALLIELSEQVPKIGATPSGLMEIEALMQRRIAEDPRIFDMLLIDEAGNGIARGSTSSQRGHNYTSRDFFQTVRDEDDHQIHITGPQITRSTFDRVLVLSRRLNHPDGSFAGVVAITIKTDLFQRTYEQTDVGPHGLISLDTDAGRILVRQPFLRTDSGRDVSNRPLFQLNNRPGLEHTTDVPSGVDQIRRVGTAHKIAPYHLHVYVALSRDDLLAPWWHDTMRTMVLMFARLVILVFACSLIWWEIKQRSQADAHYRLLANNSTDIIVSLNEEGRRVYMSPSLFIKTGWTPEQLKGTTAYQFTHPEDHPQLDASLKMLCAGKTPPPWRFRYLTANGEYLWVEAVAKPSSAPAGEPMEFVCNIRDISVQKRTEDALLEANALLNDISLTDELTGIGNRRKFDEELAREWARALRNRQPLGLLIIDIDNFKLYNDRYGHLTGDECLASVGHILTTELRRPGDMLARYGGEEFVVILADTPGNQIAETAEHLRMALFNCAIPHADAPSGVVTISIGAAEVIPQRDSDAKSLIQMADEAVYRAKSLGRNCVVVAEQPITPSHVQPV